MDDASRVRHRNSLLVLGQVRRIVMGFYYAWRADRKNQRQSTLKDFHNTMARHQHRDAWRLLKAEHRAKIRHTRNCSAIKSILTAGRKLDFDEGLDRMVVIGVLPTR